MDVLQTLFSLWTGNRCTPDQKDSVTEAIKKHIPEDQQEQFTSLLSEYCEKLERQAFDVGFKYSSGSSLIIPKKFTEVSQNERSNYLRAL